LHRLQLLVVPLHQPLRAAGGADALELLLSVRAPADHQQVIRRCPRPPPIAAAVSSISPRGAPAPPARRPPICARALRTGLVGSRAIPGLMRWPPQPSPLRSNP